MYNIKPNLKDNTWKEIIYASENNCIPDTWNIGDEIDLTLSGLFNETVTLQIWDFKHFEKSDGSGKANILFGMKHLMNTKQKMNTSDSDVYTWNDSYMKNITMENIYNSIPNNIRSHIKEVNTYSNIGCRSSSGQGLLSKDKVFIPGLTEVDDNWEEQNQTEQGQKLIAIFKDKNNRIKKLNNGEGNAEYWWLRSPHYYYSYFFCYVGSDGSADDISYASSSYGVCFCFNI